MSSYPPHQKHGVQIGGTANFRVEVDSVPLPSYQWKQVYENNSYGGILGVQNTLRISNIQSQDLGQYQVLVWNSYGNLELLFSLVPEGEYIILSFVACGMSQYKANSKSLLLSTIA